MNSLVTKSRCSLLAFRCQKLLILIFSILYFSSIGQSDSLSCGLIKVSIFELDLIDSLSNNLLEVDELIDSIYYSDDSTLAQCAWEHFQDQFDFANWTTVIPNGDGNIDTSDLPYQISIAGASNSGINNYRRYVNKLQIISPAVGFVSFDWRSHGGDYPYIDAFYFTVNDSCIQLSFKNVTEGHFASWFVQKGDIISLEQASNGSSNFITTTISNFKFSPKVFQKIARTWHFLELEGDTSLCLQQIEIIRPSLNNFHAPPDIGDEVNLPISCDNSRKPEITGYPYYKGIRDSFFLTEESNYPYSASFTDRIYDTCGGNNKIAREWKITDNCLETSILKTQKIKTQDTTGIQMTCPQNQTFFLQKCLVSVYIRKPKAWTACTDDVNVEIQWAYGSGSRVYSNVSPGRYEITFTAKDGCGQSKTCSMWLDLKYNGINQVECRSEVTYHLPINGKLKVEVEELVNHPKDCSVFEFEINGNKTLELTCDDIGEKEYEITYFDSNNPASTRVCITKLTIEGPHLNLVCPEDQYVDCSADLSDLSIFGEPTVDDVEFEDLDYIEIYDLDECGLGSIYRTWTLVPECGQTKSCTQTIFVQNKKTAPDINWPLDYINYECISIDDLHPNALSINYSYPVIKEPVICGAYEYSYSDQVSGNPASGCIEILRNWSIHSSCSETIVGQHIQHLTIEDNIPPTLETPSDQLIYTDNSNCHEAKVELSPAISTDCYGDVAIFNDSPYAINSAEDASGIYPLGVTSVTYTAIDGCDNVVTQTVHIEVRNEDDQTFKCVDDYTLELDNGSAVIGYWLTARKLVDPEEVSCDLSNYYYAFSDHVQDSLFFVSCEDMGSRKINIYRIGDNNHSETCASNIIVLDPNNLCNPPTSYASLMGSIYTEMGDPIKYVQVGISSGDEATTDEDGVFILEDIPTEIEYDIWPIKQINHRNGVNTLDMVTLNRHLLGIRELDSPYKILASDVNDNDVVSVGDLYLINKLVLGVETEMDKSWKFIDADYQFPDPKNPFLEPTPESIRIEVDNDVNDLDFIGIKMGDINVSGDPQKLKVGSNQSPLVLKVLWEVANDGSKIDLKMTPSSAALIDGFQFTISFDNQSLELAEILRVFDSQKDLVINYTRIDDGQIGISYVNYESEKDISSIHLSFDVRSRTAVIQPFWFDDTIYNVEGYIDGLPVPLKFVRVSSHFNEISAFPNPFKEKIMIQWQSDRKFESQLVLSDMRGRIIKRKNVQVDKGNNEYVLKKQDFENAGIYFLKLIDPISPNPIKIILIE